MTHKSGGLNWSKHMLRSLLVFRVGQSFSHHVVYSWGLLSYPDDLVVKPSKPVFTGFDLT